MKKESELKAATIWTITLLLVFGVALTPMPATVAAQEQEEEFVLEDTVVTASKRETRLLETPMAITNFGDVALESAGLRDLRDVITFVPGASEALAWSPGLRQYQIRGIAQGPGAPTVSYYIDDAPFALSWAPMGRSFDMERVEVLRGPQGTLYGAGAMGGTVRFIPKAPNLSDVEAHIRGSYAGTDGGEPRYYIDGALSIPVVKDKLGIRLVAQHEEIGGYLVQPIKNLEDLGDADITNLRAHILFEPTDALTFKFFYLHNNVDQQMTTIVEKLDPPTSYLEPSSFMGPEIDMYGGTLIYDFSFASLNTTFTYLDYTNLVAQTWIPFWDPFANPPRDFDPNVGMTYGPSAWSDIFNNETRLVSLGDGPFQWLLGMFYQDQENIGLDSFTWTDTGLGVWYPEVTETTTSETLAFFGNVSYEFLEGKLIPLVGLRYYEDEREFTTTAFWQTIPDPYEYDDVNVRFNLSYLPSDNSQYYLNIGNGFRAGSFNNPDTGSMVHLPAGLPWKEFVEPDDLWSYEIGTKQALMTGQMVLDVALYFQDWQGSRQFVAFGPWQEYAVGDAEIYGIDLGLFYAPQTIRGLTLSVTGNLNSAEWTYIDPLLLAAPSVAQANVQVGDRMPFVPKWTFAISANYAREVTAGWMGVYNLSYSHIDGQPGQFAVHGHGDSRDLLRARVGLESDRFGVYLFGNNLLGENGAIFAQQAIQAGDVTMLTQDYPRTIGIELQFKY